MCGTWGAPVGQLARNAADNGWGGPWLQGTLVGWLAETKEAGGTELWKYPRRPLTGATVDTGQVAWGTLWRARRVVRALGLSSHPWYLDGWSI